MGVGIETADMLVHEVLSRNLRDRKAVARYAGLTGSPDESGKRRREKGLAIAGNARVRRGMIQLAWRFLMFQKGSALAQWYRARTADARGHIPRWWQPDVSHGFCAVRRMGPLSWSFAPDAHDCIMVWILWIRRIQACGATIRAFWRAPLGMC